MMTKNRKSIKKYGVRRFATYRNDGRCFELYEIATGECASFPCTKKDGEIAARKMNTEAEETAGAA